MWLDSILLPAVPVTSRKVFASENRDKSPGA